MTKNIEHLLLQGQKPQRVVAQYQNVNVPHFIQMQLPIYPYPTMINGYHFPFLIQ